MIGADVMAAEQRMVDKALPALAAPSPRGSWWIAYLLESLEADGLLEDLRRILAERDRLGGW